MTTIRNPIVTDACKNIGLISRWTCTQASSTLQHHQHALVRLRQFKWDPHILHPLSFRSPTSIHPHHSLDMFNVHPTPPTPFQHVHYRQLIDMNIRTCSLASGALAITRNWFPPLHIHVEIHIHNPVSLWFEQMYCNQILDMGSWSGLIKAHSMGFWLRKTRM